jgi:hypothetical protein
VVEIVRLRKPIRNANRLAALRATAGSGIVVSRACAVGATEQVRALSGGWVFVAEVERRGEVSGSGEAGVGPGDSRVAWWEDGSDRTAQGVSVSAVTGRRGQIAFFVKIGILWLGASLGRQPRRLSLRGLGICWGSYEGAIFYFFDVGGDPSI